MVSAFRGGGSSERLELFELRRGRHPAACLGVRSDLLGLRRTRDDRRHRRLREQRPEPDLEDRDAVRLAPRDNPLDAIYIRVRDVATRETAALGRRRAAADLACE